MARLERVVEAADLVRSSIGAAPNFAGVANQLAFDTNQPPRLMLLKGVGRVLGGADSVASFVLRGAAAGSHLAQAALAAGAR